MAANPERHTLLPLPAWGVIPGARFREVYYWDSLWVVRGLLVSGMRASAQALPYHLLPCMCGWPVEGPHCSTVGNMQPNEAAIIYSSLLWVHTCLRW